MQEKNNLLNDNFFEIPENYILMAPGPVNLHPLVLKSLSLPMVHHRTPLFDVTLKRVLERLKAVFQTQQAVYISSATGSGGMESLIVNPLQAQDKVICIVSGKFGERWADMAQVFGCSVIPLNVEWGQSVDPQEVVRLLKAHSSVKAVLCQACETSTGVAHPLKELGQVIKQHSSALFLVDGITAVGAYPIPMDEWQIDGLVAGSQKAFMLPTGLNFVSFSEFAWQAIRSNPTPRYYFDIRKEQKANLNGETYYSSNVSLIRALDVVLALWEQKGLASHYAEIQHRAEFVRQASQKLGLRLFAKSPSDSVTALLVPEHIDSQKVRSLIEKNHHITLMGGQDQAKGKILRVGHMGYLTQEHHLSLMSSLHAELIKEASQGPTKDDFIEFCHKLWQK